MGTTTVWTTKREGQIVGMTRLSGVPATRIGSRETSHLGKGARARVAGELDTPVVAVVVAAVIAMVRVVVVAVTEVR